MHAYITYTYIHPQVHTYVCLYVYSYTHAYIYTYIHLYICMYVCVSILCMYMCTIVKIYIYLLAENIYLSNVLKSVAAKCGCQTSIGKETCVNIIGLCFLISVVLNQGGQAAMDDQRSWQRIATIRHHLQPGSSGTPSMCYQHF